MTVSRSTAFVLAASCLVLTACTGGKQVGNPTGKKTSRSSTPSLEVTFRLLTPGSDSQAMLDLDVIVQSGKVLVSRVGYPAIRTANPFPATTFTFDGSR